MLYSTDRPEFLERLATLAGSTTYREPSGARSTDHDFMPDAHAIAAALAYARRERDDIGPDVAYCWATQSDAYRQRTTRRLAIMLRSPKTRTLAVHRLTAAEAAWTAMIHNKRAQVAQPADIRPDDWNRLLLAAVTMMYRAAWDALADAERAYKRAA